MASAGPSTSTSSPKESGSGDAKGNTEIYQFKVSMRERQPIWRRVQIPVSSKLTFRKLHQILNRAMGWASWINDYHMWEFTIDGLSIGDNLVEDDLDLDEMDEVGNVLDGTTKVKSVLRDSEGRKFKYLYDFGCSWDHKVILEKILKGNLDHPVCITGRQACPPEDDSGPEVPFDKEAINEDLKKIL